MMSNKGESNVSVATKNDENHRYAILVGGEVYMAGQENTVIRPEPILSPDHSSKNKKLMGDDQDLELGTKLSLTPPSSFRSPSLGFIHSHSSKKIELMDDDQDLELGTKLSLAPPSSFHASSPGFVHSSPPQLQQPHVPCNSMSSEIFDVLERIRLLERLSYVCSSHSTTYGDIDEKGTHGNANNDDQREKPESESDYNELDLTLKL